jgi:hypothetical protein
MKTRTFRSIGIVLIIAAVVTGVGLQLAGTDLFLFHGEGGPLPTRIEFGIHWSAVVLLAVAFAGLICLVLSLRQRSHPGQTPNDK